MHIPVQCKYLPAYVCECFSHCDNNTTFFSWHVFMCTCLVTSFRLGNIYVPIVYIGPFSMKSALLSHSEWAQRAASGLKRRPRQNGAWATPQWNHTGDHHKGDIACRKSFDLNSSHKSLNKLYFRKYNVQKIRQSCFLETCRPCKIKVIVLNQETVP